MFPDSWFRLLWGIDTNQMRPHQLIFPHKERLMIDIQWSLHQPSSSASHANSPHRENCASTAREPQVGPLCSKHRLRYCTLIMLRVISSYVNMKISG